MCPTGFTGTRCQTNIDDCMSQPCRNNGICHDSIASYTCECPPGYTGFSCETNINDCQSSPCYRGTCVDGDNSFTCQCNPGYTGELCQIQIDECQSSKCFESLFKDNSKFEEDIFTYERFLCCLDPCQFEGHCEDLVGGYRCRCKPGTSGVNCEVNVNECHSSEFNWFNSLDWKVISSIFMTVIISIASIDPCRNSATCVDGINKYTCKCIAGFTGTHCEINIDECASSEYFFAKFSDDNCLRCNFIIQSLFLSTYRSMCE